MDVRAEQSFATAAKKTCWLFSRGNASLVGWDFGAAVLCLRIELRERMIGDVVGFGLTMEEMPEGCDGCIFCQPSQYGGTGCGQPGQLQHFWSGTQFVHCHGGLAC